MKAPDISEDEALLPIHPAPQRPQTVGYRRVGVLAATLALFPVRVPLRLRLRMRPFDFVSPPLDFMAFPLFNSMNRVMRLNSRSHSWWTTLAPAKAAASTESGVARWPVTRSMWIQKKMGIKGSAAP